MPEANIYNKRQSQEKSNHPKIAVAALGAAVLTALGVHTINRNQGPELPSINGPHLEYTAKAGDSEWSIGSQAYPDIDPRKAAALVDEQNPNENHLVEPGQVFVFNGDAGIGEHVDPSANEG